MSNILLKMFSVLYYSFILYLYIGQALYIIRLNSGIIKLAVRTWYVNLIVFGHETYIIKLTKALDSCTTTDQELGAEFG